MRVTFDRGVLLTKIYESELSLFSHFQVRRLELVETQELLDLFYKKFRYVLQHDEKLRIR